MSLRDIKGTIRDALPHFDGIKLRRRKSRALLQQAATGSRPETATRQRSFGSIFSFADSLKANVASRTGSVRVTRQERKTVRAQDIFFGDFRGAETSTDLQHAQHSSPGAERHESRTHTPSGGLDDCGRSSTPRMPVVLNKALLPISSAPLDDDDDKAHHAAKESARSETDVSVPDFEGYLDILSYLQRDLPEKPATAARARCTPSPPMVQVTLKTPKEEEWMSSLSASQSSRLSHSRSPSRSATTSTTTTTTTGGGSGGGGGSLSRTNSNTTKTVTPMSSVDSDSSEFRNLHYKPSSSSSVPTTSLMAEPRIEEVSEPEPEATKTEAGPCHDDDNNNNYKTPTRRRAPHGGRSSSSSTPPAKCFHCGRDPCGPDPAYTNSSFVTVLRAFGQDDDEVEDVQAQEQAARPTQLSERERVKKKTAGVEPLSARLGGGNREAAATGPSIPVEDALGRRYLLYPETAFYEAVVEEAAVQEEVEDEDGFVLDDNDDDKRGHLESRRGRPLRLSIRRNTTLETTARREIVHAMRSPEAPGGDEPEFWEDEDEEGDSDLCTPTAAGTATDQDPYERPFNPDPYSSLDSPFLAGFPSRQHHLQYYEEGEEQQEDGEFVFDAYDDDDESEGCRDGPTFDAAPPPSSSLTTTAAAATPPPSFWKDPNGVIVVYKGIEVNGKPMFYGADINYLGSFYDDDGDDGSSGLGSSAGTGSPHHSPSGSSCSFVGAAGTMATMTTPAGLCMIPEVSFSEEFSDEGD